MSGINTGQPSATRPVPPWIALWGATARRDLPQDFRDGARNCGAPQDERASPVEGRALLLESGLKGTRPTEGGRRHHGSTTSTLVSTGRGRDCMARAARKCSAVSVSACASSGVGSVTATLSAAVRPVHARRDKLAVLRRQPTRPVQPAPSLAHRYPMHGVCRRTGPQCADVRPRGSITDTVTHVLSESRDSTQLRLQRRRAWCPSPPRRPQYQCYIGTFRVAAQARCAPDAHHTR